MQTFVEMSKSQAALARSVKPGLSRVRLDGATSDSTGKSSPRFDFSFARISVDAPKRAHDQPEDRKGVRKERPKEEAKSPATEEREGTEHKATVHAGHPGLHEEPEKNEELKVASDIGLEFKQQKTDSVASEKGEKKDKVASGVTLGSLSQPDGGKVDADSFGTETYDADFNGVTHSFAKKVCTISGTLDVTCEWGARSRGRKDVPSGSSPVVSATNWPDIVKDLTPEKDPPYISPRKEYYSRDLTERHEISHGKDDFDRTKSTGMGLVKTSLEKNTVTPKNVDKKLPKMLKDAKAVVVKDVKDYYEGTGTDHSSYAGEIRAYKKGKPAYEALAADVEKHGKTLRIPRQTKRRP